MVLPGRAGVLKKTFERYVAIGDSTSEGLDDPDGKGGYRGWANRLAERIAAEQGGLLYANLAIRGRNTREIGEEQLAPALAMRPDLVTVSGGTNDVLGRRFDASVYATHMLAIQQSLVDAGATVVTFTLPDLRSVMPLARILGTRVLDLNAAMRDCCARSGAILCDLAAYPVASDPRMWSDDRLHANPAGHARIADALAYFIGLHDDLSWSEPLPARPRTTALDVAKAEWAWTRRHLLPWIGRHLQGKSSGDGVKPKRPVLMPV